MYQFDASCSTLLQESTWLEEVTVGLRPCVQPRRYVLGTDDIGPAYDTTSATRNLYINNNEFKMKLKITFTHYDALSCIILFCKIRPDPHCHTENDSSTSKLTSCPHKKLQKL